MISSAVYVNLICSLEKADQLQGDADDQLVEMENVLSTTLTTPDRIENMRNEIENERKTISQFKNGFAFSVINAVKSLQDHVKKHYGSVNSFLADNNIRVSPYFASLSSQAGHPISGSNIGSSCL
jgi:hypothetical protein